MNRVLMTAAALATSVLLAASAHAAGMLMGKNGMTLYVFDNDKGGMPSCYKACAKLWPPYEAKAGEAMMKDWTMVKRTDGMMQWAYDGKPVYFYSADKKKGDMKGDGFKGLWHIVKE